MSEKRREEAERAERGVWLQLERVRGTPWPPNTLFAVTRAWRYQRPVQHLLQESERFAQLARPPLKQCFVEVVLSRQQLDFYHGRKNLQRILAVFLRSLEVLEPYDLTCQHLLEALFGARRICGEKPEI